MLKHWREGLLSASEDETPVEALLLQPEMGNGGLLDSLSVSLPCLDVLMIHPQPVCVVDDLFYFSHDEEFGLCQILAVLEKNHCCRATDAAVAVLPNSISWL